MHQHYVLVSCESESDESAKYGNYLLMDSSCSDDEDNEEPVDFKEKEK